MPGNRFPFLRARPLHFSFLGDAGSYLTGCRDGKAWLWNLTGATIAREFSLPAEVRLVEFNPSGSVIATACANGTARL